MANSPITQLKHDMDIIENLYQSISSSQETLITSLFFLLIAMIITIIFISYAAFIRGRDTESGKIEARLEALDKIVLEQEKITSSVETIKTDIEKGVWLDKVINLVKRQKIAEMMLHTSEVTNYLFKYLGEMTTLKGDLNKHKNHLSLLLDTATLYFEVDEIEGINDFYKLQSEISTLNSEYYSKKLAHFKETQQYLFPEGEFLQRYGDAINNFVEPLSKLRIELGKIMKSLLNN